MKWIGQNIYDLISKFRNDVYLEDISTGTIASGGNLGLDSNNKIVKAAEVGSSVDLTSEVTGVLPSANLDADTAHLSGTQTFSGDKTFSSGIIVTADSQFTSSSSARPAVEIKNTGNNTQGGSFSFVLDKGAVGANGDIPGTINWKGDNDAHGGVQHTFGSIHTSVADATDGQEAGSMDFKVAAYDGVLETGLKLDGDTNADGEVDVTIGTGTGSTTTIVSGVIMMSNLPTSDPGVSGQIWNNGGVVTVSE